MAASTSPAAPTIVGSWNIDGRPLTSAGGNLVHHFASFPSPRLRSRTITKPMMSRRKCKEAVCLVLREGDVAESSAEAENGEVLEVDTVIRSVEEPTGYIDDLRITASNRAARKKSERRTYLVAAMMSSFGFMSMASAAVYYKFAWQIEGNEIPVGEMIGTFALAVGAAVGMEYWARWAHRALWHASLWHMHSSHHRPRDGPFELNDIFAIINSIPAIALASFGFFNRGLVPGLSFGTGLGITLYGMAYMFIHDGLVHHRIPVGPIANIPFFQRVAAAHQIHHSNKFKGVPYGLFLGHKELEEVGGMEELEKEVKRRIKDYDNSSDVDG